MLVGQGAIADTPANLKQGSREGQTATASELSPDGIPVASHVPLGRMGTCARQALLLFAHVEHLVLT